MRGFSSGIMGLMSVMGNLLGKYHKIPINIQLVASCDEADAVAHSSLGASAGFLYSSVGVVSIYMILAVILAVTVAVVVFSQVCRNEVLFGASGSVLSFFIVVI